MSKTIIKVDSRIEEGGLVDFLIRKNFLSEIISIFPFIIVGLDQELRLVFYNDVAEEYFKYKRSDVLQKDFVTVLVSQKDQSQIRNSLKKTVNTLKIEGFIEIPMITKNNELRFVNFILMLVIKDKEFNTLLMAGSDNTKRQVAKIEIDRICKELINKNEEFSLLHKQLQGREKRLNQLKHILKRLKKSG